MFLEREATLAEQLVLAAQRHSGVVVGIVGAEHALRVKAMLETGAYEGILQRKRQRVLPSPDHQGPYGVRRALLAAVLAQVGENARLAMEVTLGPVPTVHAADYHRTLEVYSSVRMLLAVVDPPLLDRLCCALEGDVYALFADVRAARPVHGGPGFTEAALRAVRSDRST
eukprot:GGOE01044523.1.p2 GENE.GGOE01044523.1~~GGOE01044523.1.p2  ORF type:complete len:170 (-),score=52.00 GGOE01044523.1:88-597(-)